jgi:hypothetical protein
VGKDLVARESRNTAKGSKVGFHPEDVGKDKWIATWCVLDPAHSSVFAGQCQCGGVFCSQCVSHRLVSTACGI